MKRNSWIIITCILVFFACRKELEYEGEGKTPVLVLNAVVENDSLFRVYLERTVFFLSAEPNSSKFISTGATIKVTNVTTSEVYVMQQATKDNLYEFPFTVKPNTYYKIEVNHPDYPSISSEMVTTNSVSIVLTDTLSFTTDQGGYMRAKIKWNDPSGENYYMLRVKNFMDVENESEYWTDNSYYLGINSKDPSIDNSENTGLDGSTYDVSDLLFNDRLFNGSEKTMEFNFPYSPSFTLDSSISVTQEYTINLITMNKETYLYYISMKKNDAADFFSEPVKVYSNILNGFGIFGTLGYSLWKL